MTPSTMVDPQLGKILDQMPPLTTSDETLHAIREAVAAWRLPAPEVTGVRKEEHWIESDGQPIRLLVYIPETEAPTGGLLWIFGGGLVSGVPEISDAPNRYIAKTAGCIVVAPAYRLAPEHPYPAAFQDCYAALEWLEHNAEHYGIPPGRLAIAGESAGGGLAAGISLYARDKDGVPLTAMFLMFPMLDDRTGTSQDTAPMPFSGKFVWTDASNRYCWDSVLRGTSRRDVPYYASPGRADVLTGLPNTVLSVGDIDTFIGEDLRFAQRLMRDGVPTTLRVYPGAPHGFIAWGAGTDIASKAQQDFWDSMTKHFRPVHQG